MYKTVYRVPGLPWLSNSPRILVVGYTGATDTMLVSNDQQSECCLNIFIVLFIVSLFIPGLKKHELTIVFSYFFNLCLIVHQLILFVKPFFRSLQKSFVHDNSTMFSIYHLAIVVKSFFLTTF